MDCMGGAGGVDCVDCAGGAGGVDCMWAVGQFHLFVGGLFMLTDDSREHSRP